MPRKEDIADEKRIGELRAKNAELQNGYKKTEVRRQSEIKKNDKEILDLENKITAAAQARTKAIDANVKSMKGYAKLSSDAEKAEQNLNKSLSSRIQQLVKGNLAGAIGLKSTRDHETAQSNLANKAKEMANVALSNGLLDSDQKAGIVSLSQEIKDGLVDQEDIEGRIEGLNISKEQGNKAQLTSALKLGKNQKNVATLGAKSAKSMASFSKLSVGAGAAFAVLYKIAQQFAGTVDAIGKQFGNLNVLSQDFQKNLFDSSEQASKVGASMEDVASTAATVSSEFGVGLTVSGKMAGQLIDTAKAVGLSNDEAAKLSGILQTTSGLSAQQAERLTEGAFQLAAANDVNPSAVLKDMAGAAEEFASFSKDGGDNLARAAVQARAMGLSLSTTSKVAEGLLDFEQSIAKEVEASVLIGRQLNLQKAREAALTGDVEGAMRAVVDQLGSEAEFNELNVIQRKALADSIGVSVADMAKMVANQDKANKLAGETAKSFSDIIGKDAMSELTVAMNEMKTLGVALANTLGPILMLLAKTVNLILVPLGKAVSGISSSIRDSFGSATTASKGIPFANDVKASPGGITHLLGPSGVIGLNPRDSVMATTNRVNDVQGGMGGIQSYPAGTLGKGGGGGVGTVRFESVTRGRDIYTLGTYYGEEFGQSQLGTPGSKY